MKKLLLGIGTIISITLPALAIVSCSNDSTLVLINQKDTSVKQKDTSVFQSQKQRWLERVKWASLNSDEKQAFISRLNDAKTQVQLDAVGTDIAVSLGMTWSPSGSSATNVDVLETPDNNWDAIKPVLGDAFTYDNKTFEIKANFSEISPFDVAKWAKAYDVFNYLVRKAEHDIKFTITMMNDLESNRIETASYVTHVDKSTNRMPNSTWEHFMVAIEKNGHRGSISDLITGD